MGFLIEHYGGNMPLWLAPIQVKVIPVSDAHHAKAVEIRDMLHANMVRVEVDLSKDGFGKKIRAAKVSRAPYFIIIGDKDLAAGKATLESRDAGQIGQLTEEEILNKINEEIKERK
jgi:threonyl-tRNA synthetase